MKVKGSLGSPVNIPSGVPQGSLLGPLLFAAYVSKINFPEFPNVHCIQYADDVSIIEPVSTPSCEMLPFDHIHNKFGAVGLKLNPSKCKTLLIKRANSFDPLSLTVPSPPIVHSVRVLGLLLTDTLSWSAQMSDLLVRASRRLFIIRRLNDVISKKDLICVYHAIITSLFLYACPVYGRLPETHMNRLERFQTRAHRIICGKHCKCERFLSLRVQMRDCGLKFLSSCEQHLSHPLNNRVPPRLPNTGLFRLPYARTSRRLTSFFPYFCALSNGNL